MAYEFYSIKIKERIQETPESVSLIFDIPEDLKSKFQYESGQYINMKILLEGKEERRAYSISSSPSVDSDIKITIKDIEGGKVSNLLLIFERRDVVVIELLLVIYLTKDINEPEITYCLRRKRHYSLFSILNTALKSNSGYLS